MTVGGGLDFKTIWGNAIPYDRYIAEAQELRGLWEGVYRTTQVPDWAIEVVRARGSGLRLLFISEDWCWDAAATLPVLARLGDEAGALEIRVLKRDENPEVMDQYLTNGTRSIPIVIALDADYHELGHWGPRPRELQAWAVANKGRLPKGEFYAAMRRWQVADGGESTIREVLELLK